jgi:hypothetical protein
LIPRMNKGSPSLRIGLGKIRRTPSAKVLTLVL